jgi:hypothetical protein
VCATGTDRCEERKKEPAISRVLSWTTIHLGQLSPTASSNLPGSPLRHTVQSISPAYSPIWSCSRRGLPCRGVLPPARCALTAPFHPYLGLRSGGIFSVALSMGSHPPGVTWRPAIRSPDFPPCCVQHGGCLADSYFLRPRSVAHSAMFSHISILR